MFANGTLSIRDVESGDSGLYQCVGLSDKSMSATPPQTFATRLHLACKCASLSLSLSLSLCVCVCVCVSVFDKCFVDASLSPFST